MGINDLLIVAVKEGASDLHLTAGIPPVIRVNGELKAIGGQPELRPEMLNSLLLPMLSDVIRQKLDQFGQVDLSYSIPEVGRFRVNIFRQRGVLAGVMRLIPTQIKSLEELGLPSNLRDRKSVV